MARNYSPRQAQIFAPIPMTYGEVLPSLIANQLAVVVPGKIFQPLFPKWYNPSATCAYHGGTPGHSVEQCLALKSKVQSLIEAGWLTFQEDGPNIKTNSLANQGGGAVNAIEVSRSHGPKLLKDVTTSRRFIYKALQKAGMIPRYGHREDSCLMHPGVLHDMETSSVVRDLLQQMIDQGRLEVGSEGAEEQHVYMQSADEEGPKKPKPLVIHFTRDTTPQRPQHPSTVSGGRPIPFPYENSRIVPWRYAPLGSRKEEATDISSLSAKVTNITGLSSITRSGRVFAPSGLPIQPANTKGKAKMTKGQNVKVIPTPDEDVPTKDFAEGREGCARVSLLELLMSFEPHRALLVKVLNEAHVAQDISVEGFGGIVNNITANNYLTFAEEEIPTEGRGHNRALHVSVKCMEHVMAKVLIDNGSSLNVMPKSTLEKFPFNASHLRSNSMVVRAFDGSRREVRGEIDLPVQIGPHTCQVTFRVMDINPAYSCLLGRPWIHSVGVVPSTLHQKLKFVVEGHLVIVSGEEDVLVMLGHGYEPGMGLGKNNGGRTSLKGRTKAKARGRDNEPKRLRRATSVGVSSDDESREGTNTGDPTVDFEQEASWMEEEEDEDVGLPPKLERIIAQEDREMRPHQEETEFIKMVPEDMQKTTFVTL
ncbi:uncharacterized protein [Glycine max]|uniref:uncharacterized protein n=1 Tax=Glycine max TaxID=3847 RepID=UPI0003DE8CE3|nr:uncharacterized protein LOC102662301 [Glycine max]|eukprot:XP_006582598.1 uncharacterized protein LOC102662301 [Glycine max]